MTLDRSWLWGMSPLVKVWAGLAIIVAVLATAKVTSIHTGPSADEAIAAIRVAQRDLAQAQRVYRGTEPLALKDAQAQLALAWLALKDKRYEEAILVARNAIELARKLTG